MHTYCSGDSRFRAYPKELTIPNEAKDVHQQPNTTIHAFVPPSGKSGIAEVCGFCSTLAALFSKSSLGVDSGNLLIVSDAWVDILMMSRESAFVFRV